METQIWPSNLEYHEWVLAPVAGSRPPPRYKHAAAILNDKLYIVGGSRHGRFFDDLQVLDLVSLQWSSLKLNNQTKDPLPPVAGHSLVQWENKLLVFGGNSKKPSDTMIVWCIDLDAQTLEVMNTSGSIPSARSGCSATLIDSKVIIFGGEGRQKHLLNDAYTLNLETMIWEKLETLQTPPSPRFDHTAAVHSNRYLMIFSGCSHATIFNDLHILDMDTMEWSSPEISGPVSPRAGHAGVAVLGNLYVVGGGDNKRGCCDTLVLNMTTFACTTLASVGERDALASEGVTVCAAVVNGDNYLVAFGGYNGKYNNETFLMRLEEKGGVQRKVFESATAAAAAASVTAAYALAMAENPNDHPVSETTDSVADDKRILEDSLAQLQNDNSLLKGKIDYLNLTNQEMRKELQSVEGQLVAERSRCFNLEVQIAELRKSLELYEEMKIEMEKLMMDNSDAAQNRGTWWRSFV